MDYVTATLWPEPLSPHFQAGGALEGWNEDVTFIAAFTAWLWVLDVALVRPLLHPKARYFALHACGNAVATVASFPDVRKTMLDPLNGMNGPSHTMVANSVIVAVHLYHCLAFELRAEDIFHHAVFTSVLCGLAIPFKHVGGAANNFGCFFLSGLPGGLDYVMLVLVKQGVMDALTEKRVNATINAWCRMPSMIIYGFVMYQAWLYGRYDEGMGLLCPFIAGALHVHNGVYYGQQAIGNYAARKALESAGVKTVGGKYVYTGVPPATSHKGDPTAANGNGSSRRDASANAKSRKMR